MTERPSRDRLAVSALDELRRGLAAGAETPSTSMPAQEVGRADDSDLFHSQSVRAHATIADMNRPTEAALSAVDSLLALVSGVEQSSSHTAATSDDDPSRSQPESARRPGSRDQLVDAHQTLQDWREGPSEVRFELRFSDGQVVRLDDGETWIVGRAIGDGIVTVAMRELSRRHFSVTSQSNALSVTDLSSTNGTKLAREGRTVTLDPGVGYTLRRGTAVIVAGAVVCEVT